MTVGQRPRGAVKPLCVRQRITTGWQRHFQAGDTIGRHGVQQCVQRKFAVSRRQPVGAKVERLRPGYLAIATEQQE